MSTTDTASLRQAALTLHALPERERQRVLARLDDSKRDALTPLLAELVTLGIPKGRQWVRDRQDIGATATALSPRERIARLSPEAALEALSAQSVDTAATVMQIANWPWLDQVLATWPADQRHVLRARLEAGRTVPERLAEDLLARMASNVKTFVPAPKGAVATRSPWYHGLKSLFLLT